MNFELEFFTFFSAILFYYINIRYSFLLCTLGVLSFWFHADYRYLLLVRCTTISHSFTYGTVYLKFKTHLGLITVAAMICIVQIRCFFQGRIISATRCLSILDPQGTQATKLTAPSMRGICRDKYVYYILRKLNPTCSGDPFSLNN